MRAMAAAFILVTVAGAQSVIPSAPIPLDSLATFKAPAANWQLGGGLGGDPRTQKNLTPLPGTGILINNPTATARGQLFTNDEHGDAEIDLDFLLTPGSNSGVYVMGRYEVQLLDSWGATTLKPGDCGGIYQRWDESRGKGNEGYEGSAPRANASRAPGLWQHLHIEFKAPRFDAAGKKTANARFLKVVLNDFVVQENVEVTGPTRSAAFPEEGPLGPLMIQGDHGPVAIRALAIKKFDPTATRVQAEDLAYKLYTADATTGETPVTYTFSSEGKLTTFSAEAVEQNGKFSITFTGAFVIPRDGLYSFSTSGYEPVSLVVDGQPAIQSFDHGGQSVAVNLSAGRHAFQADYIHRSNGKPRFALFAEGPGLARHVLTAPPAASESKNNNDGDKPRSIIVEPFADRIRMQRSFVPFDPKKRLYATNVGSPAGIHYAYDFETAAILRVWRGGFLDTYELWDGRAENQYALSTGPALTLNAKPVLALLESYRHDWPEQPDQMWSSQGYQLEPDGQPTFRFKLSTLSATDRIAPAPDVHGLTRTLVVTGKTTSWETWVLLAEASQITPLPDGHSYVIGDRSYYIDLPADSTIHPIVRNRNGRQQLVVPINATMLGKPIVYSLVW